MNQPLVIAKNVVNVHLESSADTELVTQAIMGQPAWLLEDKGEWLHVRLWDSYTGWLRSCFVRPLEREGYPRSACARVKGLIVDVRSEPKAFAPILTKLVVTTEIETGDVTPELVELKMPDGRSGWARTKDLSLRDDPAPLECRPGADALINNARKFIGTPYLWGGTTPFGIDCSGFVQMCYRMCGCQLLRDAGIQAHDERAVALEPSELQEGDLVFFSRLGDQEKQKITHIGIYIGDGEFIHSAGGSWGVIISRLFEGEYQERYWGARRMTFPACSPVGAREAESAAL